MSINEFIPLARDKLFTVIRRFKLMNRANWKLDCAVEISDRGKALVRKKYEHGHSSIFDWAEGIIKDAIDS